MRSYIQRPLFTKAIITQRGSSELIEDLTPILQAQIAETKYDRVIIAEQFLDHCKGRDAFEALHTFTIDSSLQKTGGNSCVGLSLDLMQRICKRASPYLTAATLSNHYQQLAGPTYCHVTPMIAFMNPNDVKDRGYIILDPNFHIAQPILLLENGSPFQYDMGGKKGMWTFSLEEDHIICQAGPRPQEPAWTEQRLKDQRMVYRLDQILNPAESSALPMFAIDRSYPIVARRRDGTQTAHLNLDLTQRQMTWKIGEEKKPAVPFSEIANGSFVFDDVTASFFLMKKELINALIRRTVQEVDLLDHMYFSYLRLIENTPFFQSLLKTPYVSKEAACTHRCRTLEPYLSLIRQGRKKIEGRVFSLKYQTFKPGDFLHLYNEKSEALCKVKALRTYPTFRDLLLAEGLDQVVPNVKTLDEGVAIYANFPNYKEEEDYGVVALEIELV